MEAIKNKIAIFEKALDNSYLTEEHKVDIRKQLIKLNEQLNPTPIVEEPKPVVTLADLERRLAIAKKMAAKNPALKTRVKIIEKMILKEKQKDVSEKPTPKEIEKFIDYVDSFYGKKEGIYKKDYNGGFTKTQIKEAVTKYLNDPQTVWGGGDSVDRELMRDRYLAPITGIDLSSAGLKKSPEKINDLYLTEIAQKTGLRKEAVEKFAIENKLSNTEVLDLLQGLGRKIITASDLVTAIAGEKGNSYATNIIKWIKADTSSKTINITALKTRIVNYVTENSDKDEKTINNRVKDADLKQFAALGIHDDLIMAFYCGVRSIANFKGDVEMGEVEGLFSMSDDYIKKTIDDALENCKKGVFELGFKYPTFDLKKIIKKYNINTTQIIRKRKTYKDEYEDYVYEIFNGENIVFGHTIGRDRYKAGKLFEEVKDGNKIGNPSNFKTLDGGYWGLVSSKQDVILDVIKEFASQPKSYVKDVDILVNNLGGIGYEELDANEITYEQGGEVDGDRMYNFLKDDLEKLENAITEGDKEQVETFFSYWNHHLDKLKTETNDRMYNFLKDDLEKLEKAINEDDKEEIERFFSYWNHHLESLKMANGGEVPINIDSYLKSVFFEGDFRKAESDRDDIIYFRNGELFAVLPLVAYREGYREFNMKWSFFKHLYEVFGVEYSLDPEYLSGQKKEGEDARDMVLKYVKKRFPQYNRLESVRGMRDLSREIRETNEHLLSISTPEYGKLEQGGEVPINITEELKNFDLDDLDDFETFQYNQFSKRMPKEEALQILINNVEGDYTQLSQELAELAEKQYYTEQYDKDTYEKSLEDRGEFEQGGSIGFIPMDVEQDLSYIAKFGGTNIKGVIGILSAMIDSGLTEDDLKLPPTKTGTQFEKASDKKTREIWKIIEPNYKGDFKGNMYYSTIHYIVRMGGRNNILERFKPFRKFQKLEKGGEVSKVGEPYDSMTKYQLEKELNKLTDEFFEIRKSYNTTEHPKQKEIDTKKDKIITLLYGDNFSGKGQKFRYEKGGEISVGEYDSSIGNISSIENSGTYWHGRIESNKSTIRKIDNFLSKEIDNTKDAYLQQQEARNLKSKLQAENEHLMGNFGGSKEYELWVENYDEKNELPFENGGEVPTNIPFSKNDYELLIGDKANNYPYFSIQETNTYGIYEEVSEDRVAQYYPVRNELKIHKGADKETLNDFLKWLTEHSYLKN